MLQVPPQHMLPPGGGEAVTTETATSTSEQQTGKQQQVCRTSDLYLAVTLELTFQPLAAGLSVPQRLREDAELGRGCSLLLRLLLQLGNTPHWLS